MDDEPYDPSAFPPFAVTADVVVLTTTRHGLSCVLVTRGGHPFKGQLALPGGFVHPDEDLVDAALRELRTETGLALHAPDLVEVGAYGRPRRDPRMRVVSIAYAALVADLPEPRPGSDAADAEIRAVRPLVEGRTKLAFDHRRILTDAVERVRELIEETPAALRFCRPEFTIAELRQVYEAVWDVTLDPANFHKRVAKTADFVEPTGHYRRPASTVGRQAELYRPGRAKVLHPPIRRPGTYFSA